MTEKLCGVCPLKTRDDNGERYLIDLSSLISMGNTVTGRGKEWQSDRDPCFDRDS